MEASALAEQVKALATSLSPAGEPSEGTLKLALDKLVEIRRLEQLGKIANSGNASTYFFGDRCTIS